MGVQYAVLNSREEWLHARRHSIGGSDASAVIGRNPYKTNQELWMEKTGRIVIDVPDNEFMAYGRAAEPHMRDMFALDFPQYSVFYEENNIWTNTDLPFAHASLDGWILDEKNRFGILEIKTTEIMRSRQKESWNNQIPDNYFIQLIHYFMTTKAEFAVLKAQLKSLWDGELRETIKHYHIERSEVEEDIELLRNAEEKLYFENILKDKKPNLILPEI